ncbi:MAG: (2Fe-2S) ferredoxin domain-containing protein [Glaciimonas sp.]|nr:(2Fe-2S) ferredoxin domain-containing protein [Glaciimonas sp.]
MDSIIEDIDEYVNEAAVVPFYVHHVFFCLNQRSTGERLCCANSGAQAAQEHAKRRIKALGLAGDGNVRINKSGCLERCEEGPALVIYPEGVWYTYFDTEDIDEIIDVHIVGGEIVERLKI